MTHDTCPTTRSLICPMPMYVLAPHIYPLIPSYPISSHRPGQRGGSKPPQKSKLQNTMYMQGPTVNKQTGNNMRNLAKKKNVQVLQLPYTVLKILLTMLTTRNKGLSLSPNMYCSATGRFTLYSTVTFFNAEKMHHLQMSLRCGNIFCSNRRQGHPKVE